MFPFFPIGQNNGKHPRRRHVCAQPRLAPAEKSNRLVCLDTVCWTGEAFDPAAIWRLDYIS